MSSAVKSSELFLNRSDLQKLKRQSNNVPEVLVVVQRIADNEFIGNLEADVVWHITVAEVGSLPEWRREDDFRFCFFYEKEHF